MTDSLPSRVLDTSAVLDFAVGRTEYARILLAVLSARRSTVLVSTATLAAAYAQAPEGSHAALQFLAEIEPVVNVLPLDTPTAAVAGALASTADWPQAPLGTAAAAALSLTRPQAPLPVVTADPDAVLRLTGGRGRTESLP